MNIPKIQSNQSFTANATINCNSGRKFPTDLTNNIEQEAKLIGGKNDSVLICIGSTTFWQSADGPKQGYKLSLIVNVKDKVERINQILKKLGKITPEMQAEDIITVLRKFKR